MISTMMHAIEDIWKKIQNSTLDRYERWKIVRTRIARVEKEILSFSSLRLPQPFYVSLSVPEVLNIFSLFSQPIVNRCQRVIHELFLLHMPSLSTWRYNGIRTSTRTVHELSAKFCRAQRASTAESISRSSCQVARSKWTNVWKRNFFQPIVSLAV